MKKVSATQRAMRSWHDAGLFTALASHPRDATEEALRQNAALLIDKSSLINTRVPLKVWHKALHIYFHDTHTEELTVTSVAPMLGVSRPTLYAMLKVFHALSPDERRVLRANLEMYRAAEASMLQP